MTREEYINQFTDEQKIQKMNALLGDMYDELESFKNERRTIMLNPNAEAVDYEEISNRCGMRVCNILNSIGVRTVCDLMTVSKTDFLRARNSGKKSWETFHKYQMEKFSNK